MATNSSVLAWRLPGTGEPGGLLSMGSHRVGHDRSDLKAAAAVQETRVATREESGVLGFPSRRGLTPRGPSQHQSLFQ